LALNLAMARAGFYREVPSDEKPIVVAGGWRALVSSRYLLLIAGVLFCTQLAQPIVDYQFLSAVEAAYPVLDERTAFISAFFSVLGLVSVGINLTLTPIIHRYLGVIAGLATQPLLLAAFSFGFMAGPTLWMVSAMKTADRGLSYSINRASKEQLYIPIDPVHTYQAKAWIDMLGYRLFKAAGAAIILLFTAWLPVTVGLASLGWLTIVICAVWMGFIGLLAREYKIFVLKPVATAA
jgi:AAA family ATP:ADP antiporter